MNEIVTYLLGQIMTLIGISIFAWVVGRSFAKGVSKEIKDVSKLIKKEVPIWIEDLISGMRKNKAIEQAIEGRKHY